jgi:hypothetical protein
MFIDLFNDFYMSNVQLVTRKECLKNKTEKESIILTHREFKTSLYGVNKS